MLLLRAARVHTAGSARQQVTRGHSARPARPCAFYLTHMRHVSIVSHIVQTHYKTL